MTEDDLFKVGLFELATGLVNSVDGSADPISDTTTCETVAYLHQRLAGWHEKDGPSKARDDAARAYVEACLVEWALRSCTNGGEK